MSSVHIRSLCFIASIFFIAICLDNLNIKSSANELQGFPGELPRTSLVEVQPSTSFSTSAVTPYPMSTMAADYQATAPLQIGGQAVLATRQTLTPASQEPVGVHVVDSPQGKVDVRSMNCMKTDIITNFIVTSPLLASVHLSKPIF
jgi:hypothetical protein